MKPNPKMAQESKICEKKAPPVKNENKKGENKISTAI